MLVVCIALEELAEEQGVDPVIVRLPLESVPIKLKVFAFIVFMIVPVNVVPVCDTVI